MKKCNACGTQVDEQARFCPSCGSAELVETMSAAQQAQQLDQGQTHILIMAMRLKSVCSISLISCVFCIRTYF